MSARPSPRSDRRARRAAWCALLLMSVAWACGDDPSNAPARFVVVQRGLDWAHPDDAPPAAPLSRAWSGDALARAWHAEPGTELVPRDGAFELRGVGELALVGPRAHEVLPELQQEFVVRFRAPRAVTVRLAWRGDASSRFTRQQRSLPARFDGSPEPRTLRLPFSALRGARRRVRDGPVPEWSKTADALEGVHELRLSFEGGPDAPLAVELLELGLRSAFDGVRGAPPSPTRLARHHEYHAGVALRAPGELRAPLAPGPHDRLRLELALAGASRPVRVRLTDAGGALPPLAWELQPGAAWTSVAVDLSPLAGRATTLRLSADAVDERAVVFVGGAMRLAPEPSRTPNVILYLEDTLRADRLQTYGYGVLTDPRLGELAEQGVVFERVFAASNWTRPSTVSLLSSLAPPQHGVVGDFDRLDTEALTLAEHLASEGYVTASFVTNYHAGAWAGLAQGFDSVREPSAYGAAALSSTLTSSVLRAPLEAWLREHADERVFVYVHTLDPHQPYAPDAADLARLATHTRAASDAPTELEAAESSRRYDAEVLHNDRSLGALVDALRQLGLERDTLLAFTSDHGEAFREHGHTRHRYHLYQEELHVPWVLRWPAGLPAGHRARVAAGHVDMAPTLAALAGLPVPTSWRGRDLSAFARGDVPRSEVTPLLVHSMYVGGHGAEEAEGAAVVRWPFKLILRVGADGALQPAKLFRLDDDPREQHDLLDERLEDSAVAELVDALGAWAAEQFARAAPARAPAAAPDPAMIEWLEAMGYVGR